MIRLFCFGHCCQAGRWQWQEGEGHQGRQVCPPRGNQGCMSRKRHILRPPEEDNLKISLVFWQWWQLLTARGPTKEAIAKVKRQSPRETVTSFEITLIQKQILKIVCIFSNGEVHRMTCWSPSPWEQERCCRRRHQMWNQRLQSEHHGRPCWCQIIRIWITLMASPRYWQVMIWKWKLIAVKPCDEIPRENS